MMTAKPTIALIPNLPTGPLVDSKGHPTPSWYLMFSQLFSSLQHHMSSEGILMPPLDADQIAALEGNPVPTSNNGRVIYDSVNNVGKINISGVFKELATV